MFIELLINFKERRRKRQEKSPITLAPQFKIIKIKQSK